MYKVIFDKDEIFTFTKDGIKEEILLHQEINLLFLICGIICDLVFLPIELIKTIKIIER